MKGGTQKGRVLGSEGDPQGVFFCGVIDEEFLFLPLMFGVIAVLFWVLARVMKKGILECDEVIEERLALGEITQQYIDKMLRPKTKEEKKEFIKKWGVYAVIIFVILFIVIGWSVSDDQSKNKYDDVFKKDPNTWSKDEKEYVDDLFNYIDSNN